MEVRGKDVGGRGDEGMKKEGDPKGGISRLAKKGGISRLAKMRKPQCTGVHEDFRIKRNAEITLLGRPLNIVSDLIPD